MSAAAKDRERALTVSGKEELERAAEAMAESGYEFDVVASSPLRRAKETAMVVQRALKRKAPVEEWQELSPEGNREALYRRLARLKPDASVLIVGHEPYLTTAMGEIIGAGAEGAERLRIVLKKGGMARLSVPGFTPRISGELRWLLTPKQIRKLD